MTSDSRLLSDRNIWLATTRPSGMPHLVPIWFVWLDERFYICTGARSVKARNLRLCPRAVVALEDGNHPLIAECSAEFLPRPFAGAVVAAFQEKYIWNIADDPTYDAVIALTPIKWLSWSTGS